MRELWRPVVGYEGLYEVSDMGNVRSLDRIGPSGKMLRGRMHANNNRDRVPHGTAPWLHITHCLHGHEFTEENTYRDRKGHRRCRACHRETEYARKKRAA